MDVIEQGEKTPQMNCKSVFPSPITLPRVQHAELWVWGHGISNIKYIVKQNMLYDTKDTVYCQIKNYVPASVFLKQK